MSPELLELRRTVKSLAFGMLWAFVVLIILSVWLATKHADVTAAVPVATWMLAFVALALAVWLDLSVSGLVWKLAVLVILFIWLWARPPELPGGTLVLALTGIAALACLGLIGLGVRRGRPAPELPILQQQLGVVRAVAIAAGGLLFLMGVWLGFSQKLEGLGDSLALCVLALIALGTAGMLRQIDSAQPSRQEAIMHGLVSKSKQAAIFVLGFGVALVAFAIYLRFGRGADFPEWGGVLSLGFTAVGAGIWLLLSTNVNINSLRMMILIVGGLVGLVIFMMAAGRAWLWRDDLFFRGIAEWRGPGGWRIWLCAYMGLFGLALMFGSFYLARTDIRANPVLRRVLYGYNAIFTGLLLLAFLVVLNVVVYAAFPQTYEWSQTRGLYTLSDSSKHTLQELKQPTTIYVVLSRRTRIFKDLQLLLDNCQAESSKLNVEYIFPDKDFVRYDTLATRYPEIAAKTGASEDLGRGVLLVYGAEPENPKQKPPPNAFVPATKLFKADRAGPRGGGTYTFVGEQVLLSELKFLMGGEKKSKIYFLQGNGELALKNARVLFRGLRVDRALDEVGMEVLIDLLKKENYEVRGLSFGRGKDDALLYHVPEEKDQRKEVPKDADIVVIAGASNRIPKETLDALERYMDRDGKLVVLADLRTDTDSTEIKTTGLEEFLKKYSVDLTNDFVMRFPADRDDIPVLAYAITAAKSENLIAKKFADQLFRLFTVRVVKPDSGSPKSSFKAEPLLEVRGLASETFEQSLFWAENQASALPNPIRYALDLQKSRKLLDKVNQEVIPVAVTVTDNHPNDRPRLVVFGDAEWASDAFLGQQLRGFGRGGKQYFNLLVSSFDWLSKRPGVGGRPKEPSVYSLNPTASGPRMVLLPLWLMVVVVFALGLGTWLVRRK